MEIWTTKEVAEFLHMDDETIRRLTRSKQIPAYRVGRVWRYKSEEIKSLEWAKR